MKVKSILKVAGGVTRIDIIEAAKDENGEEYLIDHDVDILEHDGVERITSTWIKYGDTCLLPTKLVSKNVDMVSTNHATGALVIYTK